MKVKATVHGAISIVNAIATGKGATLGTEQQVIAIAESHPGKGITLETENGTVSSRLINKTVEKIVPKKILEKNKIELKLESDIPTGYGLKSSSAISSAVALACAKMFKPKIDDQKILLAGVDASIETKVSLTGAYDDACACYFGGFNITDNLKRKLVYHENCSRNIVAVIFIPKVRKRGNIKKLRTLDMVFEKAWEFAKNSDYWNAMTMNGLATSAILNSDSKIIPDLIEKGAIAASISGNGPSIAAVTKTENVTNVKKVFLEREGQIRITKINNKKAEVHEM